MPDYYTILSRALESLPDQSEQTRNDVYKRAHEALQDKLKQIHPAIQDADMLREAQAFREAAARLEMEFGARAEMIASGQTQPQKPTLTIVKGPASGQADAASAPSPAADGPQKASDSSAAASPAAAAQPVSGSEASAAALGQKAQQETPRSQPQKRVTAMGDHEFLPAALEILESPPSPVRMQMLIAICAFVICGLLWSFFGHLDIVAVAQGKFQPTGRVNVVQPVETGKVKAIHVTNNARVTEGAVLVEMEPGDAQADVAAMTAALGSLRAEVVRRKAVSSIIASRNLQNLPALAFPEDVGEESRQREQRVFESDMAQVAAVVASLEAQSTQKEAENSRIRGTIEAQEEYVKVLQERVTMRELLVERAAGARANVIDALEKFNEQRTQLAGQRGQLKESQASLIVLGREIEKTFQGASADNNQKLLQAQRQLDDVEQKLAKSKVRLANMFLRAPNAGIVQALSVINPGQVVGAGEQIMRVIPDGLGLEIEGYLQNKDIGFIKEGQDAIIKVESFPFTKYGYIEAKVMKIARDAVPLPEASQTEVNPAQSQRPTGFGGSQRMQNLVYQVTLKPLQDKIGPAGDQVQLMPGMAVTLEIKTGQRRIISYLFTPLVEVGSVAMRER